MRKTIKNQYFHICGMQTSKERTGVSGDPNYIMAGLYYDPKKGYYWDIRPVYLYTLDGIEMVGMVYDRKVATGSLSETLVSCSRQSKKKENEAIELFDSNVVAAIGHRLRYRIDTDKAGYKDAFDKLLEKSL